MYTKVEPFPAMFILNNYDRFETIKEICDEIITDMYVVKGLTYITLEKEDPTLDKHNILKIFSYTRGLDFPSPELIDDLIAAKYGRRLRFFGEKDAARGSKPKKTRSQTTQKTTIKNQNTKRR